MTLAHIALPGMVARIDTHSDEFAAMLSQLFVLSSAAEHADIEYGVVDNGGSWIVRRGDRTVFEGPDAELALVTLYGDLYERFIASEIYFLLHAGAAVKQGRAIVLPGSQESGKSTLTTLLAARGWSVISDDIGAIDVTNMQILPYPRRLVIRSKTLELNGRARLGIRLLRVVDAFGEPAHIAEPTSRACRPSPIGLIAFPRWAHDTTTKVTRLSRGQAAAELMDNSLNLRVLAVRGVGLAAEVSRRVPAYRLSTGDPEAALDRLEQLHAA